MNCSDELFLIASAIALCSPEQSDRLRRLATMVRRMEVTLDEIVEDARIDAELAERGARTVRKIVPSCPAVLVGE